MQEFFKFLEDFSPEAGTLGFFLALFIALIAVIRWLFKRKPDPTPKIKVTKGGVVNTGTVNGDIKTGKSK